MVDFLICGTQKGGTSALTAYLTAHPHVCMANNKEVHFFDNDPLFTAPPNYDIFHAAFNPGPSHRLFGEATPVYMWWHAAPQRIWAYNPNMRLIVLLRNPTERAYSHWTMEHARHADTATFGNAIRNEERRCRSALPLQHRLYSYISRGFYLEQLRRLWTFFPRRRTLALKSEDLRHAPGATLDQVCDFLAIDRLADVVPQTVHASSYGAPMDAADRDFLRDKYEYDVRALERELAWDCSDWLI